MTAPTRPRIVSPECQLGEHRRCAGNRDFHVAGEPIPVLRLRCACTECRHPPAH